ncbi:MAG: dockerin type I domain-containing protein [Planctomycetota bacterium]
MMRWSNSWILGICLLAAVATARATDITQLDKLPDATASIAMRLLVGDDDAALESLEIGDAARYVLPVTGVSFTLVKVVDQATADTHAIALDDLGRFVDAAALLAAEASARRAQDGALDARLVEELAALADSDTLEVAIWLRAPEPQVPDRTDLYRRVLEQRANAAPLNDMAAAAGERLIDPFAQLLREEQQQLRRTASEMLRAQMLVAQAGLLAALAELGLEPSYVSPYAPLIHIVAAKQTILALAQRADVDTIYGQTKSQDYLDVAKRTHKADVVDTWNFQGASINVGILEDSRIDFTNVWLPAGTTRVPADVNVDDHATACAGMVASQHATFQGLAQSVALFSANATTYGDANLTAAIDWAAGTQNLDVINNSWGDGSSTALNVHDRHYDYVVRYQWSSVTAAAGNDGLGTGNVGSPGKAFSVITCGGINENGTDAWSDDAMYGSSSTIDPSTGAEKPEVVAAAESITSTVMPASAAGGIADAGSGTSYATPMVTAAVADVMDASNLTIFPELTKAVVLATALHNIEGSTRLSEQDGTGGVDARAAVQLAEQDYVHDWREVLLGDLPYSIYLQCSAGEVIRAVICWDSNPNAGYTTDPLQADIDLHVYGPTGAFVTSSVSIYNPFEIVEFTAATAGTYEFRVTLYAFSGTQEFIGFAAWSGNKVLVEDVVQTLDTPPPVYDNFRFNAELFWNAAAIKTAPADQDLYLYPRSAWGDPADYDLSDASTYGASSMDWVVVDCNHAPTGPYFLEVRNWFGAGNYTIEHSAHTADIWDSTYGPFTMSAGEQIEMFDTSFFGGLARNIALHTISGDANLGMFLYKSDPADPASLTQPRYLSVASASFAPAGEVECLSYTSTTTDWLGLLIENSASTVDSTFMIYADSSAPTGSMAINGGAAQSGASRVLLDVTASDPQTDIRRIRIRSVPSAFGAWQALATPIVWDLAPGAGLRTVEVEIENNACMTATVSDSITVYACPQPAGPLANGDFSNPTGLPWCFTDQSANGLVQYTGGQAVVTGGNDGVSGFTYTYISQVIVVPAGSQLLSFDWSYASSNGPGYDGAFWDLRNASTGTSLIGGSATLSSTTATSGTLLQSFTGGVTVELLLGTYSVDNIFGPGITTFDNVALTLEVCDAVTGLVCNGTSGNAVLSWTNGEPYTELRVARNGTLIATLSGTATTYTDSVGPPGTNNYSVTGVCSASTSSASATCSVTVACLPVTSLVCTPTASTVQLSWILGDTYTQIRVLRGGSLLAILGSGATNYTDSTPPAGTNNYQVIGDATGVSASAATCSATVPCDAVTGLTCMLAGPNVQLTWGLGDTYSVQIRVLRDGATIATLGGSATSYTDGAPPAGAHTYQVIGDCSATLAAPAANCNITVPCDAVTGLTCLPVGANVQLSWGLGDTYSVQIRVLRDGALIATLGGTSTSYTDVGVPAGPHTYQVIGECGAGLVAPAATCMVSSPCDAISGLVCSLVGSGVQLSWNLGDSYIQIRVLRDGATIATLSGSATSFNDSAPPAGTHTYQVIGDCSATLAAPAASCNITVPCDPVTGLTCLLVGASVQLSWGLGDTYSLQIRVLRNGATIATLGGSITSFTDGAPPAGTHTYQVIGDCSATLAAPAASCNITVPCDPVTGLVCSYTGTATQLSWGLGDVYTQIRVLRGGSLLATLGGGATSFTDASPPAGTLNYQVIGDCGPTIAAPAASCTVSVPCDPITGLSCSASGTTVTLSWSLGDSYASVRVSRDSVVIATLAGSATGYVDSGVAVGSHMYAVEGDCGAIPASSPTCLVTVSPAGGVFVRGDCNTSGSINIADAVALLNGLFVPGSVLGTCLDACDGNNDGMVNIADAVYVLNYLFVPGSPPPPAPFPGCGPDPTPDALTCSAFGSCGP